MSRQTHTMTLRSALQDGAIVHRHASLNLQHQLDAVATEARFTTKSQHPRVNPEDPVVYFDEDSALDQLPPIDADAGARRIGLVGDLSDLSEDSDEDAQLQASKPRKYKPPKVVDPSAAQIVQQKASASLERIYRRVQLLKRLKLVGDLSDVSDWESEDEHVFSTTLTIPGAAVAAQEPAQQQQQPEKKKNGNRGGASGKRASERTPEQRAKKKKNPSNRVYQAVRKEVRKQLRLNAQKSLPPKHAPAVIAGAQQYQSTFSVEKQKGNSAFVAPRQGSDKNSGATQPVLKAEPGDVGEGSRGSSYRGGFYRRGLAQASPVAARFTQLAHRGPSRHCNEYVKRLVREQGYLYVPNIRNCAQVFVDAEGVVYGVKPPQPQGDDWPDHVQYLYEKLKRLKEELHISSDENLRHARGRFTRFSFGTSHGGGQTQPTEIYPDWHHEKNKKKIREFLLDPIVQLVCRHLQNCIFTSYPEVAKLYEEVSEELNLQDVFGPGALGFNLPFAAHTFNLGPLVQCLLHRDSLNWPPGICPVVVLGEFDHTTSGQFVIVEAKVIIELQHGDVFIFLSSLLTHGNAPLAKGEERMSWTCWMPGGLIRWIAAGHRLVNSLNTKAKQSRYAKEAEKWRQRGKDSLLSFKQLCERYNVPS